MERKRSPFLTVSQVARELNVSPATVRRWCDAERLVFTRIPTTDPKRSYRRISRTSVDGLKTRLFAPLLEECAALIKNATVAFEVHVDRDAAIKLLSNADVLCTDIENLGVYAVEVQNLRDAILNGRSRLPLPRRSNRHAWRNESK